MKAKKTVKKSTKKPSAKQLAARKKFAEAAKARAKKSKTKTRKTSAGKRVRTEAAKKARRAKNTVEGYYPNPVKSKTVVFILLKNDEKKYVVNYSWGALTISSKLSEAKNFSVTAAKKLMKTVHGDAIHSSKIKAVGYETKK